MSAFLVYAAFLASAQGAPSAGGEPFRFAYSYVKGDKFRVLSSVDEDVYVNHRLASSTEILNRIAYEIADANPDGGSGLLRGTFETSEREHGASSYVVTGTYDSEFWRDRLGRYTIDPKYYMPVVRDDPTFPDKELAPGDTWTAPGEERHDFRAAGIPDPYPIPIDVRYRYIGSATQDGAATRLLTASYTFFVRPSEPRAYTDRFPVQIAGYSEQKIHWDPSAGDAVAYEEKFDFVFDWSDGTTYEFRGSAHSKRLESQRMDRASLKAELERGVAGMPNVSVASSEAGVTISIEDIQFEADSARLRARSSRRSRASRSSSGAIRIGTSSWAGTPRRRAMPPGAGSSRRDAPRRSPNASSRRGPDRASKCARPDTATRGR